MENTKRDSRGRFVSAKQQNLNKEEGIEIPTGYEIDMEKLKIGKIVLRKKEVKKWEDILVLKGCYIKQNSRPSQIKYRITNSANKSTFIDTLHAERAIAEAQISQLMQYYGGEITKEEWMDETIQKFSLIRVFRECEISSEVKTYQFLSFHTVQQALDFRENNHEIITDYFMMS